MRLLPAALHASRLALLDVALTRGRVQSADSASKDATKPAKQAGVEGKKQSAEEDAAELKVAPDHSRFNPQPVKKGAEQSAPLDNMAKGPCLHPALECCARHEACRETLCARVGDNTFNNDRTEGSSKPLSCRQLCRFSETPHMSMAQPQRPRHLLPTHVFLTREDAYMFFAEEENTAGTASAGPTVAADADPGARNAGRGGSRGVTGGGFQRRPRTEQEEAEEENYKNAQNFDEYAKSVKRSCKLTLANLMGAEEPAAGPEEAEETVGEGCDEEEYYEEGEEGEYEEGEEYYYEEEAAPLPELDGMPALRSRKDRALEELDDWWKEGSLGVEYENTRVWNKRSADVFDPTVDSEHDKLKRDLTVGRSGSAVSARGGRDGGFIRQPVRSFRSDDDGWTQKMVNKLFTEQRAGVVGKQTSGSQTMFQQAPRSDFGRGRGGASRGGRGGRGGDRGSRGGFRRGHRGARGVGFDGMRGRQGFVAHGRSPQFPTGGAALGENANATTTTASGGKGFAPVKRGGIERFGRGVGEGVPRGSFGRGGFAGRGGFHGRGGRGGVEARGVPPYRGGDTDRRRGANREERVGEEEFPSLGALAAV